MEDERRKGTVRALRRSLTCAGVSAAAACSPDSGAAAAALRRSRLRCAALGPRASRRRRSPSTPRRRRAPAGGCRPWARARRRSSTTRRPRAGIGADASDGDRMSGIASASRMGRATDSGRRGKGGAAHAASSSSGVRAPETGVAGAPARTDGALCGRRRRGRDGEALERPGAAGGGPREARPLLLGERRPRVEPRAHRLPEPLRRLAALAQRLAQRLRREGGDAADAAEQQQILPHAQPERLGAARQLQRRPEQRHPVPLRDAHDGDVDRHPLVRRVERDEERHRPERNDPPHALLQRRRLEARPGLRGGAVRDEAHRVARAPGVDRAPVPVRVRGRRLARGGEHRRPVHPARLAPRPAQREPARGAEVGGRARGDRHADSIPQRKAEVAPRFALRGTDSGGARPWPPAGCTGPCG